MKVIGAYAVVVSQEAARKQQQQSVRPADRREADREQRPGLRQRIRKLFGSRPRVLRDPGFAASRSVFDEFVPRLTAYPYPATYR